MSYFLSHFHAPVQFVLIVLLITVSGANAEEQIMLGKFTMKSIDDADVDLSQYKGKVLLIINVASECGLTPQYEQLQQLYDKYADQGLAILAFPCNQFSGQEPGTPEEIKAFCQKNYGVTFDLFAKVQVNGDDACELYKYLTGLPLEPKGAGDISWNFEKFVVGRDGTIRARFSPPTAPDAPEVVELIEAELAKR